MDVEERLGLSILPLVRPPNNVEMALATHAGAVMAIWKPQKARTVEEAAVNACTDFLANNSVVASVTLLVIRDASSSTGSAIFGDLVIIRAWVTVPMSGFVKVTRRRPLLLLPGKSFLADPGGPSLVGGLSGEESMRAWAGTNGVMQSYRRTPGRWAVLVLSDAGSITLPRGPMAAPKRSCFLNTLALLILGRPSLLSSIIIRLGTISWCPANMFMVTTARTLRDVACCPKEGVV